MYCIYSTAIVIQPDGVTELRSAVIVQYKLHGITLLCDHIIVSVINNQLYGDLQSFSL